MYDAVAKKLAAGDLVILDGGTGTHIQTLGAPMDDDAWCAMANLNNPEIVKAVHAEYLAAGAEVITANTYATSPTMFEVMGRADEIPEIDRTAVRLAREAADEHANGQIAVAGSMSVMRVVTAGSDRTSKPAVSAERVTELMKIKAGNLAAAGCDLIIMEMLRDTDYSLIATEAAVATGLPVWVGISIERREDGELAGFDDFELTLEELIGPLMATGADVCCVMQNDITLTSEAIEIIKANWPGPIGAYPESGVFKMPNWQFGDIEPAEFATYCKAWREAGASIIGGCCGIAPAHIKALSEAFDHG